MLHGPCWFFENYFSVAMGMSPNCEQAKRFPATIEFLWRIYPLIIYLKMSPLYCKSKLICKHSTESRAAQGGSNCCITVLI